MVTKQKGKEKKFNSNKIKQTSCREENVSSSKLKSPENSNDHLKKAKNVVVTSPVVVFCLWLMVVANRQATIINFNAAYILKHLFYVILKNHV